VRSPGIASKIKLQFQRKRSRMSLGTGKERDVEYDSDARELSSREVLQDAEVLGMGEIEGGENVEVTEIAAAQRRFGSTSPNGSERDVGVRASIMGSLEYLKPLIKQ
jgi:hypothetical protein